MSVNHNKFIESTGTLKTFEKKEWVELINKKWGLDSLSVRVFDIEGDIAINFDHQQFLIDFLKTRGVSSAEVEKVDFEILQTTIIGKGFFKKLWQASTPVVRDATGHPIQQCLDVHYNNMWLTTALQNAILNEDSEFYDIFTTEDRKELIFQLMKLFVIGGIYCQYEDNWDTYEPIIISFYRDIVGQSVVKNSSGAISIIARPYLLKKINDSQIGTDIDHDIALVVLDVVGKKVRLIQYHCTL